MHIWDAKFNALAAKPVKPEAVRLGAAFEALFQARVELDAETARFVSTPYGTVDPEYVAQEQEVLNRAVEEFYDAVAAAASGGGDE